MDQKELLVLGSVNADFTLATNHFPEVGQTVSGSNFTMSLGGKGANQAFYANQLGIKTTMICGVGQDYFGQFVLDELKKTSLIVESQISKLGTGKAFVFVSDGDNRIILDPGANYGLDLVKIKQTIIDVKSSYLLTQLEIDFPTVLASLQFAKTQNCLTILNPAPANVESKQIYQVVDYLVLNETEAVNLSNLRLEIGNEQSYHQICDYFLNLGVKNVLLTLGKDGSFFKNATEQVFVPSLKIIALNSTGAGDSYLGAFLAKIMQGRSIKEAMEFATKIAAQVCQNYATQVKLNLIKENNYETRS